MNILVFTSLWPSREQPAHGIFVRHRIAALSRRPEVRIRVVAPVPWFPSGWQSKSLPGHWRRAARMPEREEIEGLMTCHPRYFMLPKIGMRFQAAGMAHGAFELARRLHEEDPIDIIDAHYAYPDGVAASRIGDRLNIPVFITVRGTDLNLFPRWRSIRRRLREGLEKATGVIAVSRSLRDRLLDLGIPADLIAVVPNGVDRSLFHWRDRDEARRALGLARDEKIVLSVGSLVPAKGFEDLIRATSLPLHRNLKLYLIGEGPQRPMLTALIEQLGLVKRVHLRGAVSQAELPDWYAAADLFCLPSHREGCPNVVLEALACGTPVVATDVGDLNTLLSNPPSGRIIPVDSVEELSDALAWALEQPWDRAEIARQGSARSWDQVADELLRLYQK